MPPRAARPASILAALALFITAASLAAPSGCAQSTPCAFNSDCPVGYCNAGTCQKDCVDSARDCALGFVCNENAQCVPGTGTTTGTGGHGGGGSSSSSSSSTSSGSSSSSSSSSGSTSSGSTSSSSSSSSTSSSGGTGSGHELDRCTSPTDCAAGLSCKPMSTGGASRCTRACASDAQCMAGTRCNQGFCLAEDTGRACTQAANPCNGYCVNDLHCTSKCTTGADCPNGYGCMPFGGQRVCIRAEALCDQSDISQCASACNTNQGLLTGCTTACTTAADCPQRASVLAPWTCESGFCSRPGDVYGPLPTGYRPAEYYCNAQGTVVNLCEDGFSYDFVSDTSPTPPAVNCGSGTSQAGAATDSCVDTCRYQGGCPSGFNCVGLGNGGSVRFAICVPGGAGEVGAPCTHNVQCAFGYCTQNKCSRDCTADGVCPGGMQCVAGNPPAIDGQTFRFCQ